MGDAPGKVAQAARGPGRPGPDPELVRRAARLREQGLSDRQVADELGVSRSRPAEWLGPSGRGRGRGQADVDDAELVRLRDGEGLTWREVGARLGVSAPGARDRYGRAKRAAGDQDHLGSAPPG